MYAAGRRAQGRWVFVCLFCFCSAAAAQSDSDVLRRAEQLAWEKQFQAAEALYREILRRSPQWHDATLGLARVILWEGRYREARRLFTELMQRNAGDVEAAEGAATAAYWQGDFRTAVREFAAIATKHPERVVPRQNLTEIQSASRGDVRIVTEGIVDDQPYSAWRTSATVSSFSDPLTRWDVTAGAYQVHSPLFGVTRNEPFVTAMNEITFPWQRVKITTTAGLLRWPDGLTRPIGGLTIAHRLSPTSTVALTADHRELLTNSSSVITHAALTHLAGAWSRYAPQAWMAGLEGGRNRYFDRNRGVYIQAYALWPITKRQRTTVWIGASAAWRNSDVSRFAFDAISSTRSPAGDFLYSYRGSYRPYWTPQRFREGRAIVSVRQTIGKNAEFKAQAEYGAGHDLARAFGPDRGGTPLPTSIFSFDFDRSFHPYRLSGGLSLTLSPAYRFDGNFERNVTTFYSANAFRASLVRHR